MFDDLFSRVYRLVEDWQPRKKHKSEAGYRDDLLKYLRDDLNKPDPLGFSEKHSIRKESGRHLADIGIDGTVGIELKHNLKTKAETDRLFGQIDDYLKGYESMIIVLCGNTNDEYLDYLEEKIRNIPQQDIFSTTQVEVIIKNGKKRERRDPLSIF